MKRFTGKTNTMKTFGMILLILTVGFLTMANKCTEGGWKMDNFLPTPKDSICTTIPEGESFICSKLRNPEAVNSALYLLNAAILDGMSLKDVKKEKAAVDEAIWWLKQPSVTGAAFQKFIVEKADSLLAVAAAEELSMFEFQTEPMFKADKMLLILSLEKTGRLIDIAIRMKS